VNDPDRRHSSGASDYDAIFADIVAHLNDDDVMEAEEAVRPDTGDADHDTEVVPASGKDAGKESPSDAPADPAAGQVDQADQPSDQKSPDNDPVSDSVALSGEVPLGERDPWSVPLPPLMPRQEDLRDPLHEDEERPFLPATCSSGPSSPVWAAGPCSCSTSCSSTGTQAATGSSRPSPCAWVVSRCWSPECRATTGMTTTERGSEGSAR
jgi:hypothetical protein